jgi:hypothetical protein
VMIDRCAISRERLLFSHIMIIEGVDERDTLCWNRRLGFRYFISYRNAVVRGYVFSKLHPVIAKLWNTVVELGG